MSFKKKDLEIVYNLRWKNGPKRDNKETSIIAVYDIPATTLNFEVFKSYLLKNSGISENDVRVSYIMDNGKEYPIQSQTDFQVALYAFRSKARSAEIINLLLETISDQPIHKNLRHSNDVETQFDNVEQNSIVSTCCNAEIPPEWFISCMAQLKKEITEEITATISSVVSAALSNGRPQAVTQAPCHHHIMRKSKQEKRIRKITPHLVENTDAKDLIKTLKLDSKLERLELKASKYREKRMALHSAAKSSDSEAGPSSSRSRSRDKEDKHKDDQPKMDAKSIDSQTHIPRMLGGEIYLHQWEVQNTGEAAWTSKTHLQYTWGSKSLEPLNKIISLPFLKPGETGPVSARLQIPNESGRYECYWQFMHKGRRFGQWLGCQVIVEPFDLKGHRSVLETSKMIENHFAACPKKDVKNFEQFLCGSDPQKLNESPEYAKSAEAVASFYKSLQGDNSDGHILSVKHITERIVRDVSNNVEKVNFAEIVDSDSNSSECDNQSLLDGYSSSKNSFKDEFVVVPVPQCFYIDGPENIDQRVPKSKETIKQSVAKASLEQPGTSSIQTSGQESSKKVQNTSENNFDDNNNAESVSGASANSIKLRDEDLDNIVVITVPKDEQVKEGYIYVHVDGQKVLIPKNILKSDIVNAAQELEKSPGSSHSIGVIIDSNEALKKTPTPSIASTVTLHNSDTSETRKQEENTGNTLDSIPVKNLAEPLIPECVKRVANKVPETIAIDMTMSSLKDNGFQVDEHGSSYFEANNYMSHCSAAGSCFSEANSQAERQNRFFIFPQDVPGYEVIYPVLDLNGSDPNLITGSFVQPCQVPHANAAYYAPPPVPNPFVEMAHVPNFQQTPPEQRTAPVPHNDSGSASQNQETIIDAAGGEASGQSANHDEDVGVGSGVQQDVGGAPRRGPTELHNLPETLVSGAVNAASTAINTARSVINMIKPQAPGSWVNGHWVSRSPETPREANLQALAEMGFWNRDLNATLLARFNDDLNRVVAELVQ